VLGETLTALKAARDPEDNLLFGYHGAWEETLEAWGVITGDSRRRATDAMSIYKWLTLAECWDLPVTKAAELARQRKREKQGKGDGGAVWVPQPVGAPLTRHEQSAAKRLLEIADDNLERAAEVLDLVRQDAPTVEDLRKEAREMIVHARTRLKDLGLAAWEIRNRLPKHDDIKDEPAKALKDTRELLVAHLRKHAKWDAETEKRAAESRAKALTELAELTGEVQQQIESMIDHAAGAEQPQEQSSSEAVTEQVV